MPQSRPCVHLLPGVENIRQQRPALGAAFTLAVAVAGIAELEAMALRISAQAGSYPPRAMRATIIPAGAFGADRLRALAAWKWLRVWCVVAPDNGTIGGHLSRARRGKAGQKQKAAKQRP